MYACPINNKLQVEQSTSYHLIILSRWPGHTWMGEAWEYHVVHSFFFHMLASVLARVFSHCFFQIWGLHVGSHLQNIVRIIQALLMSRPYHVENRVLVRSLKLRERESQREMGDQNTRVALFFFFFFSSFLFKLYLSVSCHGSVCPMRLEF